MKILSSGYQRGRGIQIVVRHGVWPIHYYRIYCGKADSWNYKDFLGWNTSAKGATKALLTAHFWQNYRVSD